MWFFRAAGSTIVRLLKLVVVCIYVTRLVSLMFFGAEAFVRCLALLLWVLPFSTTSPFSVFFLHLFQSTHELFVDAFLCVGGHRRRSGRGYPPCASLLRDPHRNLAPMIC